MLREPRLRYYHGGDLVRVLTPQPPLVHSLNAMLEGLTEQQLSSLEGCTLEQGPHPISGYEELEHQLITHMGPNSSYDGLQVLSLCLVEVMTQFASGEPISSDFLAWDVSTEFPPGLRNAMGTVASLVAMGHASSSSGWSIT